LRYFKGKKGGMVIVTVSRRTDIPAFYSEWFMRRIEEGYFVNVNPFNVGQRRRIPLDPEQVDIFLFITKNPGPLMPYLRELDRRGYRYYFHYTLNDYPAFLEPRVPILRQRTETFRRLSEELGPRRVVWRYDPIVISQETTIDYHLERFSRLAEELKGYTDQAIISLLQIYPKVQKRLQRLEAVSGFRVIDIRDERYRDDLERLLSGLAGIARENGLEITSCAEVLNIERYGIKPGSCVDGERIAALLGRRLPVGRDRSQRPHCRCLQAVDMGTYDMCRFHCYYCYANRSERAVDRKTARYRPEAPTLGEQKV